MTTFKRKRDITFLAAVVVLACELALGYTAGVRFYHLIH